MSFLFAWGLSVRRYRKIGIEITDSEYVVSEHAHYDQGKH